MRRRGSLRSLSCALCYKVAVFHSCALRPCWVLKDSGWEWTVLVLTFVAASTKEKDWAVTRDMLNPSKG